MASTDQNIDKKVTAKDDISKKNMHKAQGVKKKRKWIPENKMFKGSLKEGQGFAFKRKQKFKHDYKKLLHKERKNKNKPESKTLYTQDKYPEHLKHLYMAEAEKLKNEVWMHRVNRSKERMRVHEKEEEKGENADADVDEGAPGCQRDSAQPETSGGAEQTDSVPGNQQPAAATQRESLPISNRMRKKQQKKTSYERAKEAFEAASEKRRRKKEEFLKNKQQREEAIERYKKKKMENFQILSRKTKKGQPNLNLQMEYLLQKIQGPGK
eukprot:XP_003972910.2 PREDICTED: thyroid transcription factor 1-associated protein 26 [Takifugu rubripes]